MTDITSTVVTFGDRFLTSPYYFKADESKSESSGSNNCSQVIPFITSDLVKTDDIYYATDGEFTFITVTGDSPSNIPYTISLFINGTNATVPPVITVDDSTFTIDQKIKYKVNTTALGIWYESEIKYEFKFKPIVWDLSLTDTNEISANRTFKNDPIIKTPIKNLTVRKGEYLVTDLDIQTNKTITNAPGGIYLQCIDTSTGINSTI